MPPSEALVKRLGKIPIFKTLQLKVESADHGSAILTAPYDAAYDGVFESFLGGLLMTLARVASYPIELRAEPQNTTARNCKTRTSLVDDHCTERFFRCKECRDARCDFETI